MLYEMQACRRDGQIADGAHGPVLYLLLLQNRELPYASVFRGKPAKGSTSFGPGR